MTVKELRERLVNVPDDSTVVLYDGLDEGDVFATCAFHITRSEYCPYCAGDSCLDEVEDDIDLFVLSGDGASYVSVPYSTDMDMDAVTDNPELVAKAKALQKKMRKKRGICD